MNRPDVEQSAADSAASVVIANPEGADSQLLQEMLEHQGVVYDEASESESWRYPVVLAIAEDAQGRKVDEELYLENGVMIAASKLLDMERVRRLLSGTEENTTCASTYPTTRQSSR